MRLGGGCGGCGGEAAPCGRAVADVEAEAGQRKSSGGPGAVVAAAGGVTAAARRSRGGCGGTPAGGGGAEARKAAGLCCFACRRAPRHAGDPDTPAGGARPHPEALMRPAG